jgi:sialate O-acetylesterase
MKCFRLLPVLTVLIAAVAVSAPAAELKLAAIFGDNMVLQQNQSVPVWGWSDPGDAVTVAFGGRTAATRAGADGKWLVKLAKLKADARP